MIVETEELATGGYRVIVKAEDTQETLVVEFRKLIRLDHTFDHRNKGESE